jgi:hypothetical protein
MKLYHCFERVVFGVMVLMLALAVAHAADADPNGFQGRIKEVPHPCYAGAVQDCVELIKQEGTVAYCHWAAAIAGYAAYRRDEGVKEADLLKELKTQRPLSANELKHIKAWFGYGYTLKKEPYFVIEGAREFCLRTSGLLLERQPQEVSQL